MDNESGRPTDRRLRTMLVEAGLRVKRVSRGAYDVTFPSELREWGVTVRMSESWVMLRTFVLALPPSGRRRQALLEASMQANANRSLIKFSLGEPNSLYIDLEYREEHVTPEVLKNLISLVVNVGDAEYPKLFRLATGDDALDALESAFKRDPSEG
jgi:hypothetical protein